MNSKFLVKYVHCLITLIITLLLMLSGHGKIIAKEKNKNNRVESRLPPDFLWCGTSDNNTYLDFCFQTEKVCKNFALKRRETNGGKLTLCRPTRIK